MPRDGDNNGDAETRARERLANNGRNSANRNAGIRVGSDLHLCEMLLKELDTARTALTNAATTIAAIYEWVDRVEAIGGVTCIEGAAKAHHMMASLKKNRPRVEKLVLEPARRALKNRPAREHRPDRG